NYYLLTPDQTILHALHPIGTTHYQLPPKHSSHFSTSSVWSSHQEVEQSFTLLEKESEFNKEKKAIQAQFQRQMKKLQKKEKELSENLKQCMQWSAIQHEGDLIKTYFSSIQEGNRSTIVQDWVTQKPYTLTLDPSLSLKEEMVSRYR